MSSRQTWTVSQDFTPISSALQGLSFPLPSNIFDLTIFILRIWVYVTYLVVGLVFSFCLFVWVGFVLWFCFCFVLLRQGLKTYVAEVVLN